ncbi:MAG TPA: PQQ-binding-like beta-propeller repeat protein [Planctomycetaceae bacterium]|jgi:outer membrane protein assembly factor BamB|nr:PQQ-binding-like beta-propeller repeat protein [Planctomycetaceae bacterium]
MSATTESVPAAPPVAQALRPSSWLSKIRLLLAILATVTLLPYAWGRTLVVYGQWRQVERQFLIQLLVGIVAVIALNFHLAQKFRAGQITKRMMGLVLVLWIAVEAAMIVIYNGDAIPIWLIFAGFFPATLWVIWTAWMFFTPMRWSVRLGVLALLILAVVPYQQLFEVNGLTGDARVNFALRSRIKPDDQIKSTVGELTGGGFKLVANSKTDFPAFQGPARTAVLPDTKLDRNWSQHPPREIWRVPVGAGWSGIAVVGGYTFTQEQRGEDECVVCRELSTGKEIWKHADKAPFQGKPRYEGMGGPGPRCTPTVDDGRVYTVGCTGIFNCLDGGTGHVQWTRNMVTENGGHVAFHGVCGSPLIVGNLVVVAPTGKSTASLAAYDRLTGKPAWCTGVHDAAYATPMLASVAGHEQILNYDDRGLTAHNPTDGKVLWHFEWNTNEPICSQPIADAGAPDQILLTVGYGRGSVLLKVSCGADGSWTAQPLWETKTMKTKFTTAVARDGYVYGLDDGIMQCIDLKTGRQKWKGGRYEHGQILLAGDLIVVQTEPGPVVLIEATPKRLTELGTVPALSSKTWNCPTLAGNHLLLRNDLEAVCYEVALEKH